MKLPWDPITYQNASEALKVFPRVFVTFIDAPGRPQVVADVARTPAHRARGLMFRRFLPENEGMLFSWPDEQVRSFWMKDTLIPLDMIFIDKNSRIAGIRASVPALSQVHWSVPVPVPLVLEVNAGWAVARGVAVPGRGDAHVGQRVVILRADR